MSSKYVDYYKVLGVSKEISQDDMQRAYRKLARKYHPDVNKDPGAEDKFKEISEAYEVLKDPEKRKMYNELGSNWQQGQDFRTPSGWENVHFNFGSSGDAGGFSDFFNDLFGGRRSRPHSCARSFYSSRGSDQETVLSLTIEEAYNGGKKNLQFTTTELSPQGMPIPRVKTLDINIPKGVLEGQKIRLAGQGGAGSGGGAAGDLYLKVIIEPHPVYKLNGRDIYMDIQVSPWEAALGASVSLPILGGSVSVKVPHGSSSGKKMRLKGKGFPTKKGRGNLYLIIKIVLPPIITPDEKKLFKELASVSKFNPRAEAEV